MEQYTIDGKIEEVSFGEKRNVIKHRKLTIKEKYRAKFGTRTDVKCKDCRHCSREDYNDKHYYKCKIMGISSSAATDIRLKDYGCSNFIKKEQENEQ